MMRTRNINMTTKVRKQDLLETLKKNLAEHADIVQEARNGYIKKAKEALEKRLEELRLGKVVSLMFSLSPPVDYSEVYKSAIKMLEWNTEEFVELGPDEFRQLVEDQWDWRNTFGATNALYSSKAWDWLNDSSGGALVSSPRPE